MNELQLLFTAAASYFVCPIRHWRLKIIASIYLMYVFGNVIHNAILLGGFLPEGIPALYSFISTTSVCLILGVRMLTKWDHLPNDAIRPGYVYEVIGKPRTDLQMIGFILTAGKGGEFALTNGVKLWKFCRSTGRFEELEFDTTYTLGKKVIELGPEGLSRKHYIKQKLGSRWSLINNCITLRW